MTNPAAITVFGVLGAPGVELSHLADPMAAASAVDEADVLSAETLSFFEAGPAPGELADLYQTYQTAMEEKNQDRMSEQKERIARRMRSLSEPQWQAMIRRAQLFGQNKFHCFAAAIANAGIAHQIQTIERDTAEGKNLHEAKKTLCRIAAMAAFGDANAWNTLCAIADGESSMALTAVVLVERREELVSLAAAPDRLTFARIANALLQREYDKILEDLLAGRAQPDNRLARRLEILSNGLDSFLNAIDDIKAKAIADWRKNHEANILLHDGVGRILLHFQITSTWMSEGNIKSLNAMAFAGLGSEFELLGLARTAVLKNALGIAAKGIEVRIDLPQGIEIVKGQTDNLVASLVELIHNAVKYAVDSKPEKWIHIDWHPLERALTVSDNGLGIQDTEAVWEGRREHTEGEGHGLAIVRKRLEADRWKGKVISVPGEVTTFKLLAPVGAVVYSEDHLKGELKHQRDEFRDKGVFDFSRLSAELLSQMTPEEQLEAGKEAVAELEAATHRLYDSVQKLKADDLTGFKELIRHHYIFYKAILRLREEAKIEPAVAGLFNNLFSSVIQMLSGMEQVHNGYRKIKNGKIPWEESIQAIPNPYAWVERSLTKGDFVLTYQAPHSRIELADTLIDWLKRNFPEVSQSSNGLQFQGIPQTQPITYPFFQPQTWPPDPAGDLVLKTYVEMLEWTMRVEEDGGTIRVRLDFQTPVVDLRPLEIEVTNTAMDLDESVVQMILNANRASAPFQKAFQVFRDGMPEAYQQTIHPLESYGRFFVHELLLAGVLFWANGRLIFGSVAGALSQSQLRWAALRGVVAFRMELFRRGVIKNLDDPIPRDEVEELRRRWEEKRGGKVIPLRRSEADETNPLELLPDRPDEFDWLTDVLRALLPR